MTTTSRQMNIGRNGREYYICDSVTSDILILGTSRAEHHYNAQMISDSLGIPCYNAGEEGCGIVLAYGRLLLLLERYTPNAIIYDVTPGFDYLDMGHDIHNNLKRLKQNYDRRGIDSIFWDIDSNERYKMISILYRHNSSFLMDIIEYFFGFHPAKWTKGFSAFNGEMDNMKVQKDEIIYDSSEGYKYDSLKISYLNKFLDKTKDINVVFVMSPWWTNIDTLVLGPIKDICTKRNIELIDFSNNPKYIHHNEFFKDGAHLNARGADEFTRDLIHELKKRHIIE
jgi:hypothetical protein